VIYALFIFLTVLMQVVRIRFKVVIRNKCEKITELKHRKFYNSISQKIYIYNFL